MNIKGESAASTPADTLTPPRPTGVLLVLRVPEIGGGNADDAAAEPPPRVSIQQARGVSAEPQVIHLLMDHHGSADRRHRSEQRRLGFNHRVDFPLLGVEVAKVSGVVGVIFIMWIVVATGGVTPRAQVSELMDVHRSEHRTTGHGEATDPQKDLEFALRIILLEQHLAVHFGQTLSQRGAGSHFAGCIQSAIVLRDLRWSQSVTMS